MAGLTISRRVSNTVVVESIFALPGLGRLNLESVLNRDFPMLQGAVLVTVLAVIVAYPCFRFRITGHYFVLVTLALSGIVLQVITATRDYTGGSLGYTPDRTRGSHLWALQFDDKVTWYLIALGIWALGLVIWRWVDGSMDRYALEAISEDEDAAAAAVEK